MSLISTCVLRGFSALPFMWKILRNLVQFVEITVFVVHVYALSWEVAVPFFGENWFDLVILTGAASGVLQFLKVKSSPSKSYLDSAC